MGVGPSDCSPTRLSLGVVPPRFLGLAKPETHQLLRLRHYPQHRPLIRVLVAREQCGRVSFHPPTSGHSTRHTTGCRRPASVRAVSCWVGDNPAWARSACPRYSSGMGPFSESDHPVDQRPDLQTRPLCRTSRPNPSRPLPEIQGRLPLPFHPLRRAPPPPVVPTGSSGPSWKGLNTMDSLVLSTIAFSSSCSGCGTPNLSNEC
jgi:hypothetical protein